jgi:transposase, IS5 family
MAPHTFPGVNGAIVLRTKVDPQPTLWETILPPEFLALPPGLEAIDRLLDDPVFFEPFVPFFNPVIGRPSIPIETYLRMMFLRFRYRLGFETLCAEVADSWAWRRFCRIPLTDAVPHASTLMKITTRCGPGAVEQLNQALWQKALAAKVVRLDKVRADTTVVPANVAYPTDSGLLAKRVAKLTKTVGALHALGLARRTRFRDRRRSVRRRAHQIAAWLRRRSGDAEDEVLVLTGELATISEASINEAQVVATNARRALRRAGQGASGQATALVTELERTIGVLEAIVVQTRTRLAGEVPNGATRIVSLHDTDARPIAKGRLGKPIEFGYKAQVADNTDGIVVDHNVEMGNPPDAPMLASAVRRIKERFAKVPRSATADRGYGEAKVQAELHELGVTHVAIPRKGRPGAARQAVESSRRFRKLIKWRTGSEGRISHLQHSWGWERTMYDGIDGARRWCGWGVLAHNATKIAVLIDERDATRRTTTSPTSPTSPTMPATTTNGRSGRPPPPTHPMAA